MGGSVTSSAGICAMPNTSTMTASTPAHGMPAISRQMPTMMACRNATPSTPLATERMVAAERSTNSSPRFPSKILWKIERIERALDPYLELAGCEGERREHARGLAPGDPYTAELGWYLLRR